MMTNPTSANNTLNGQGRYLQTLPDLKNIEPLRCYITVSGTGVDQSSAQTTKLWTFEYIGQ